jgi:putative peptidoglycan lipid II flippase
MAMTDKQLIIKKTVQIGSSTLLSRFLGVAREFLMVQYLGAGIISDAFITAFKIPNSLRKIFAEGALSVALVPTFVGLIKENHKEQINRLMTLSFLIFQGILLAVCVVIFFKAEAIIHVIAPGWYTKLPVDKTVFHMPFLDKAISSFLAAISSSESTPQIMYAVAFLRILISFIIFLSSSALLAGALQAANHFFIPAFGQVLMNIVLIIALLIGLRKQLPVSFFCYAILAAGCIQFFAHLITYFALGFRFSPIDRQSIKNMNGVLRKFLPCLLSMSVMEINLFLATSLGTFLKAGSISLIYYANRFMGIPLGIFATAFSTVLLPYFTRVNTYAPERLSYFLYEAAKFIAWVTVPAALFFSFISQKLFYTLYGSKLAAAQVQEASLILMTFLAGLFFFSLNKILLNLYYARHNTKIPLLISVAVTIINFCISYYWLMPRYGAIGIALAMTLSTGLLQSLLCVIGLVYCFKFKLYLQRFILFIVKFTVQLGIIVAIFISLYAIMLRIFEQLPTATVDFFINSYGFWLWIFPLWIICFFLLFKTKKFFGITLFFID